MGIRLIVMVFFLLTREWMGIYLAHTKEIYFLVELNAIVLFVRIQKRMILNVFILF